MAITTLLKTGNELSVDPLMKKIANLMLDDFKIVVVEVILSLCLKFLYKYRTLSNWHIFFLYLNVSSSLSFLWRRVDNYVVCLMIF